MKIIIIGAGSIGTNIARQLEKENHEVYIVESDRDLALRVNEKIDAKVIIGNSTDPNVLRNAGIEKADIIVAVTHSDEVNLIVCSLADAMSGALKIARIRNTSLVKLIEQKGYDFFHIDEIITPEKISSEILANIIEDYGAKDAIDFADGKILLRAFNIQKTSPICCQEINAVKKKEKDLKFLIVAIKRKGNVFFPRGDTKIEENDRIYALFPSDQKIKFLNMINPDFYIPKKLIIFGASTITKMLIEKIRDFIEEIVVIEPDEKKAEKISEETESLLVINGIATDAEILNEAGIKTADFFIAASQDEHSNLVSAVLAKKLGAKSTAIISYQSDLKVIIDTMGIDILINPRILAAYYILRFVRGTKIRHIAKLANIGIEAIELIPEKNSPITKKEIKDIKFPKDSIAGAYVRNGKSFLVDGNVKINEGEPVIVFCSDKSSQSLIELFSVKKNFFNI